MLKELILNRIELTTKRVRCATDLEYLLPAVGSSFDSVSKSPRLRISTEPIDQRKSVTYHASGKQYISEEIV